MLSKAKSAVMLTATVLLVIYIVNRIPGVGSIVDTAFSKPKAA